MFSFPGRHMQLMKEALSHSLAIPSGISNLLACGSLTRPGCARFPWFRLFSDSRRFRWRLALRTTCSRGGASLLRNMHPVHSGLIAAGTSCLLRSGGSFHERCRGIQLKGLQSIHLRMGFCLNHRRREMLWLLGFNGPMAGTGKTGLHSRLFSEQCAQVPRAPRRFILGMLSPSRKDAAALQWRLREAAVLAQVRAVVPHLGDDMICRVGMHCAQLLESAVR